MRPVIRYRSQLPTRRSYKPDRKVRIWPPLKESRFRPTCKGAAGRILSVIE
ncbi:MAG TPA: hypothetical protein VHH73_05765 [Verrucomicrobiae bacterium]|nr:hypothetical protein [Verrucomicrobiae bacterium]